MRTWISENFYLEEFLRSRTAAKHGILNLPGQKERNNIEYLVRTYLQPFRNFIESPMIITSGYRTPELNALLPGSSETSAHKQGWAVDFVVVGETPSNVCALLHGFLLRSGSPSWEEIINEYDEWIHFAAYGPGGSQNREVLKNERIK